MKHSGPRLRDVAEASKVDTSVVSRILSGDENLRVRHETRERVLAVAAQMGYRPNTAARALKTSQTRAIGMIVPDLASPVDGAIIEGASLAATSAGYQLFVMSGPVGNFVGDLNGRVDGVLITLATRETNLPYNLRNLPALLVNRREFWGLPSVRVDYERAGVIATEHLLELGHTRIAHLAGLQRADTARRRLDGYMAAMRSAGIPVDERLIVNSPPYEESGMAAAELLLSQTPRPTAIFVHTIRAAAGAVAAARRLKLDVPRDLSIIAIHDAYWAPFLDPPMTTVRMPLRQLGERAVNDLLRQLGERAADDPLRSPNEVGDAVLGISPELIVRGSTAPPGD